VGITAFIIPIAAFSQLCINVQWAYNYPTFEVTNLPMNANEKSIPGLVNALKYDKNFFRVQIEDDTDVNAPVYDYYGYQFGGLYRYTEYFTSSAKTDSTYSMSLTPWDAVCSTVLPSPAFASYPGLMDCSRAATCAAAGSKTLKYGAWAAGLGAVYLFLFMLPGLLGIFGCCKGAPIYRFTPFNVLIAIAQLILAVKFWQSFKPCGDGLAAAIAALDALPGVSADSDPKYDNMKGNMLTTVVLLAITLAGVIGEFTIGMVEASATPPAEAGVVMTDLEDPKAPHTPLLNSEGAKVRIGIGTDELHGGYVNPDVPGSLLPPCQLYYCSRITAPKQLVCGPQNGQPCASCMQLAISCPVSSLHPAGTATITVAGTGPGPVGTTTPLQAANVTVNVSGVDGLTNVLE
jgi:hypothetical protein